MKNKTKKNRDENKRIRLNNKLLYVIKNLLASVAMLLLFAFIISKQPGYKWVYNDLLKSNMKVIKENPHLSFDDKMTIKLGSTYKFLLFLKEQTPENATILYPTSETFYKEGSPFKHEIANKLFSTRFLYPRKIVLEEELQKSKYVDSITHVAIVNGELPKFINNSVKVTEQFGLLPIKR